MTRGPSDTPEQEFVEATVELRDGTDADELVEWCAGHGIDVLPMSAGALLTGPAFRFEEAFGMSPGGRSRPLTLPVPQDLRETVQSVTVLPIPELHTGDSPSARRPSPGEPPEKT
ncbi:hypothetical protein GCM10010193_47290 [Kitasatospora atroaurantiaca]|uniref:Uncharacterized protein n=1 Tax=Kitasatospora atroaurantiaca TaxID=285545 RepID=A0A561EZ55_9ACTN|nr:hypothetical protein [Kitasatospora atroaurantiaca]TWE20892.1 hypothetical protein FB465_6051 [Kitasatospora atroaurantiaca]